MNVTGRLVPERPYSLALTAARYARFPEVVDRFDGAAYRRFLPVGRSGALLSVRQEGSPARAALAWSLEGPAAGSPEASHLAQRILHVALGAAQPVRAFYRVLRDDPVIGPAIRDFPGLRGAGVPSLWEALVTAILAQQVNLRFAYDIRRELSDTFGRRGRFHGERFFSFPEAKAFAGETRRSLRRFRLSDAKARAILGIAEAFASGALTEAEIATLDDEAAIERLTSFRGIGRWTAEIGLLRGLGRADVFPAADLGVVKYLAQELLGRRLRAKEADMRRWAERWRPWRGLALVYGYAELNRRREGSPRPAPPPPRRPSRGSAPRRRG